MIDGHPKITKGSLDTDNAHKKLNRKKEKNYCQSYVGAMDGKQQSASKSTVIWNSHVQL
jgi:hypothetical protein